MGGRSAAACAVALLLGPLVLLGTVQLYVYPIGRELEASLQTFAQTQREGQAPLSGGPASSPHKSYVSRLKHFEDQDFDTVLEHLRAVDRQIRSMSVEIEDLQESKKDLLRILDRYDLPIGAQWSDGSPDGEDSRGTYSLASQGDGCHVQSLGQVRGWIARA